MLIQCLRVFDFSTYIYISLTLEADTFLWKACLHLLTNKCMSSVLYVGINKPLLCWILVLTTFTWIIRHAFYNDSKVLTTTFKTNICNRCITTNYRYTFNAKIFIQLHCVEVSSDLFMIYFDKVWNGWVF